MAEHNDLGRKGELLAQNYLERLGYKIVEVNWSFRKFEIDLIVENNNQLIFVEVKTRGTDFFGNPEEAVTQKKQEHLINGADSYVQENEIDLECRFDIVAVIHNNNKTEIKHIKDAFTSSF